MNVAATEQSRPGVFKAPASRWWQAIGYCLLLALFGLSFYPALFGVFIFLVWRWRNDRYNFLVELILLLGGFAFARNEILPIKLWDIALVAGVIGMVIYRKNKLVSRLSLATLGYIAILVILALTSVESMSIQFLSMRRYFLCVGFFIPLLVFADREFKWEPFMESVTVHALVICGFYVVDTMILNGFVLLPGSNPWSGAFSFTNLPVSPLSFTFPRHYPPGLYWLFLLVVPITTGRLRLSWQQWTLIVLAVYSSRTNSLLFALMVCFICFRKEVRQVFAWAALGVVALVIGYAVDAATGRNLRLADNIDQFAMLKVAEDEEDLAEFGTGRMAQIIPKWLLLDEMDRMAVGFGFLHPTKTTNPIFQVKNEFYSDVSQSEEVATAVEETHVQTILDCGYIGLIAQTLYYVGIFFIIRRQKYARDYLCVLVGISVLGVGGFAGLFNPAALLLLTMVLGAILMANNQRYSAMVTERFSDSPAI